MRRLYLIRHATAAIQPNVPDHEWPISDRGIEQARTLAETVRTWGLQALYASRQPKAQSTAAVIGEIIGLPVNVVDGLEEGGPVHARHAAGQCTLVQRPLQARVADIERQEAHGVRA